MTSEVQQLIAPREQDFPYEEDVTRNPYSVKSWLRYVDFKSEEPPFVRYILYERALKEIPMSYKIWLQYLRELKVHMRGTILTDRGYDKVNNAFDRCLVFLHKMPRIWMEYIEFLTEQKKVTKSRKVIDRALRSLPFSQHERIWKLAIKFVKSAFVPPLTGIKIFKRFLKFDPSQLEEYVGYLISTEQWNEAAHQFINMVNDEKFVSRKGKTRHQLWVQLCEIVSRHSTDIFNLKVDAIIRSGLGKFSEDVGMLWTTLANYYSQRGQFDKARDVYEEGMQTVITVKDFTQLWDAYAKFEDLLLGQQVEATEKGSADTSAMAELDLRMARYEHLIERQPLLVNSVLLRQNPHSVADWLARAEIYMNLGDKHMVVSTYGTAISSVDPQKAKGRPSSLWIALAQFYYDGNDIDGARKVYERAIKADFKFVDDLATVFTSYVEMELVQENYENARDILNRATSQTQNQKKLHEKSPVHDRLFKSTKLWTLYADFEESLGTFAAARAVYERMIELRVSTPQVILNYASFLEQHKYFEESFRAYEKGISNFPFPHCYDLWITYLGKFVERYGGRKLERARELFEQVIADCPPKDAKVFYYLYAKLEEDYGLARRAMAIYDRACKAIPIDDRLSMYAQYILRATEFFGLTRTREIYAAAVENLPEKQAKEMCIRFASMEKRLGEIDRARAIWTHGAQFANPSLAPGYWAKWREFEMEHGNKETFREMIRVKRSVAAAHNSDSTQMGFVCLIQSITN
eukprot:TRINITY_DN1969_c1_g1_i1.p1 TRINITY_DN1969_c1_g1~~TRINITY_DN1969_c1_g1_i1.p1  ORF type:complete len:749 (-),score=222.29 TRINITY_DN1969_c1_g1_i1:92-2338(-)